jgi:flagellar hook-associated protein 1 FlgK
MSSIRPTFTGFETAKTAVFTNQKSLDIVGNNLANVNTDGYTRQRVDRASIYISSSTCKVASNTTGLQGMGVEALGVSQMRDSMLDTRFRNAYTQTSYHSQANTILSDLQKALGDGSDITDESGLHGAIKQIYTALNDYMSAPTLSSSANVVMSAFQNATQVLQQMNTQLANVQKQSIADLGSSVDRVNTLLQRIAELNETISTDSIISTGNGNSYFQPNELLDQRNSLLDELAGYGDISVSALADGTVDVTFGGHTAVSGKKYSMMNTVTHDDNTVSVTWSDSGKPVCCDKGSLRASTDFINGRGPNMQKSDETSVRGILYYQDCLNTYANALVKVANSAIPELNAAGDGPLKKDGTDEIVYKTLLGAKQPDGTTSSDAPVTAANISISDQWTQGGAGYFVFSSKESVTKYAQQLCTNLTDNKYTFQSVGEEYSGTFTDFEINFLAKLGSDLNYQAGRQTATGAICDDLQNSRDEVSGVNRDEETTDMVKYQKSYEAAARLMTTLDEMLDVLINKMGRVGL